MEGKPYLISPQEYQYQHHHLFILSHPNSTQYLQLHGYAYPHTPLTASIPPPSSILPLPPPRLASIRVRALRALEISVGNPVLGRGPPVDQARAVEWAAGPRRHVQALIVKLN